MPFLYADRVRETSTSTGTGTFALAGAVSNFRTFASAIGASNTTYYAIVHRTAAEWEVGYGTLDALGTTLTRTTVLYSSTGSAVSFTAGTKDVFVTIPSVALSSISTPNSTGSALQALTLSPFGTSAGNTAEIRFLELAANGTNYVGFKASDSLAGNQIWTLPTADGTSGQFLQTNGSGVTTWATVTSVGTVTTGTWNASAIGILYGGTGQTTASAAFNALSPITTLGDVIYGSGTNTSTRLAGNTTTTKQFLSQTGTGTISAIPAWSTVSKSDVGLGSVENTALSTWAGSTNLTTLGTIGTGTWNASTIGILYGGTGATTKTTAFNALTPMTTLGDTDYHDGTNGVRLAGNTTTTKQFLSQTGTGTVSAAPSWSTVSKSDVGLGSVENTALSTWAGSTNLTTLGTIGTGTWNATTIGTTKGGTGLTAIGTANQVLGVNSGATALEYKTLTQGSNVTITHGVGTVTIAATGTVTSVGLSLPSIFTVSNSPVTSSGTLTGTLATQSANLVFSGPTTGVAATPTFRSLVAADLPTITSLGTVTAGTWNASIIGLAYGGTNANLTAVNGAVAYSTASALALTAAGTANQVLVSNGAAAPTWASGLTLNAQQALLLNPFGTSAGNTSELRFAELAANGTNYVGFKSADSVASNLTWTLPNADGANGQVLTTNGSGTLSWAAANYPAQGRLTLTSGVPVTTGDVTAATVLYYTPYIGNQIALYTGTTWSVITFSEVSLTLSTISGGFSGTTKPYDIFGYLSSGSLAIEGLVWTSEKVRATSLAQQNGIYVKSGDATRRYLGTIFPSATNQTEDSESKRYVWNMYNRVVKNCRKVDTTASWTYNSTTTRIQNNTVANRFDVICGEPQGIHVTGHCDVAVPSAATPRIWLSYALVIPTSVTAGVGTGIANGARGLNANMLSVIHNIGIDGSVLCTAGFTCFMILENVNTTVAVTFYGGGMSQGIHGTWLC